MSESEVPRSDLVEFLRQMAASAAGLADRLAVDAVLSPGPVEVALGGSIAPEGHLTVQKISQVHGVVEVSAQVTGHVTRVSGVEASLPVDPALARRIAKWATGPAGFVGGALLSGPLGDLGSKIAGASPEVWHELAELARVVAEHLGR
jgi:hypothetical protein